MVYFKVWVPTFFVTFRLYLILNELKLLKKIAFLVEMAIMASFRPKIKKKNVHKFLAKIKLNENHKEKSDFEESAL
jgi:hypothetical protein